eukprot:2936490-Heterocapsa_arctica.AAC.1
MRTALLHLSKTLVRSRGRPTQPRWLEQILTDPALLPGDSAPPPDSGTQPGEEEVEEEEGDQQEEEEGEEEEVTEKDE